MTKYLLLLVLGLKIACLGLSQDGPTKIDPNKKAEIKLGTIQKLYAAVEQNKELQYQVQVLTTNMDIIAKELAKCEQLVQGSEDVREAVRLLRLNLQDLKDQKGMLEQEISKRDKKIRKLQKQKKFTGIAGITGSILAFLAGFFLFR